jgi:hypothetical protein
MFLPSAHGFSMDSAWISKLSTGETRCDIRISPTFCNEAENLCVQRFFSLLNLASTNTTVLPMHSTYKLHTREILSMYRKLGGSNEISILLQNHVYAQYPITWTSKMQTDTSLSRTESEFLASHVAQFDERSKDKAAIND